MIGTRPGRLEPRHVGEIDQFGRWREAGDEIGKAVTIEHQYGNAWRMCSDVNARHCSEKFLADEAARRWEAACERIDEADDDIIAIDSKAFCRNLRRVCGQRSRYGQIGIEEGGCESIL